MLCRHSGQVIVAKELTTLAASCGGGASGDRTGRIGAITLANVQREVQLPKRGLVTGHSMNLRAWCAADGLPRGGRRTELGATASTQREPTKLRTVLKFQRHPSEEPLARRGPRPQAGAAAP